MAKNIYQTLAAGLWKIYHRPELQWDQGSDFPWNDPEFGGRTLREHLDESHGAASRSTTERLLQIDWLWEKLNLAAGAHVLDVTCGPGLYAVEFARRGCQVVGVDINPAAIAYATDLASREQVASNCTFIEQDVRRMQPGHTVFDAALLLYEQLAVYSQTEAQLLLSRISRALKPGGWLCLELLNQDRVDKTDSSWWFTDDTGLWGDAPFLHLGERTWNETAQASIERYHILHLETGEMTAYTLFDQTYAVDAMVAMLRQAGFSLVEPYLDWAGLPLYDASEWVVYLAQI